MNEQIKFLVLYLRENRYINKIIKFKLIPRPVADIEHTFLLKFKITKPIGKRPATDIEQLLLLENFEKNHFQLILVLPLISSRELKFSL